MAQKRNTLIPRAPAARILIKAGAKRVSAEAAEAFAAYLEEAGLKIAEDSIKAAKHAGRKTVHDSDIRLAARR